MENNIKLMVIYGDLVMNKEEIEELKDFTIDLTDIDEIALGLEVCSKKSNMVIQEFADTIIQLQQENKRLKDKLIEINEVINGYMPNVHAMCKAFDEIEFILSKGEE